MSGYLILAGVAFFSFIVGYARGVLRMDSRRRRLGYLHPPAKWHDEWKREWRL